MNVFEILFEEIAKYNALGSVMLIGDLNARTGNLTEKLVTDSSILDNELNCDFNSDADIQLNKRVNKDTSINTYGRNLIQLLSSCHMFILNGRTLEIFLVILHVMFITGHHVLT